MSVKYLEFDYTSAQSGIQIHFANIQAEDLYISGLVLRRDGVENPDVHRIFEQRHKMISIFAMEQIFTEMTTINLGGSGTLDLRLTGDLLYGISLVALFPALNITQLNADATNFPADLTTRNTIKKFGYCTSLGPAMCSKLTFVVSETPVDQQRTNQAIVVNNLMRRYDQRSYYNQLIGNTLQQTSLETGKDQFKVYVPIQFFFSGSPQKSLQWLKAGSPQTRIQTELKNVKDLLCYTRNLKDYDFATNLRPSRLGYLCEEIFLSEAERLVCMEKGCTNLMEQNVIFEGKFTGTDVVFQPTAFVHPCKWLSYGVQKAKYLDHNPFLAYRPILEGVNCTSDLLNEATIRFILKFAAYEATLLSTHANLTTIEDATTYALLLVTAATLLPNYTTELAESVVLSFNEYPVTGVIKSMFQGGLATEINNSVWSIDSIFNRIQPYAFSIDGKQRFLQDGSILLQGGTLTLEEASRNVDTELKNHIPAGSLVTFVANGAIDAKHLSFKFCMNSVGLIPLTYGVDDALTPTTAVTLTATSGATLFSNVTKDVRFNYGLDEFDVMVTQWDNFGKYIDGSGDLLQMMELAIGQTTRFKKSGFYTQKVHQMNYFPGRTHNGVHIHSFALDPLSIQPTGCLNMTKSNIRLNVSADVDVNDLFFMNLIVYNIIEYEFASMQVLYTTSFL